MVSATISPATGQPLSNHAIAAAPNATGPRHRDHVVVARKYIGLGCGFMAVGVDTTLLAGATQSLAQRYKNAPAGTTTGGGVY